MSRIGSQPIEIPNGVTVAIEGSTVKVKGSKGALSLEVRPEIAVEVKDNSVITSVAIETNNSSAFWGMTRALIANMVKGVSEGYEKRLQLVGVGYRAKQSGKGITLSIGFSHPVEYKAPEGVELVVEDDQNIVVRGADKQLVGLTAAQIRKIRKPEPYKGKGIKYKGEVIHRKAGKSGTV